MTDCQKNQGIRDRSNAANVVSLGALVIDLISYASRFPNPGETLIGHSFRLGYGGKGANGCVAAARLGVSATIIGKVGNDSFGANYLVELRKNGISSDYVSIAESATGTANIVVTDEGQNSIVFVPGASGHVNEDDIKNAEEIIRNAKVFHCTLECPMDVTIKALKIAKNHGVMTVVNAAPSGSKLNPELFGLSDVFCVNETEAEFASGKPVTSIEDARKAADVLLDKGCRCVIITMGEGGATYKSNDSDFVHIPAKKVKAVDSTGAGDAFVGAIVYFLSTASHLDMNDIIRRSCDIATTSVLKPGTQSSYPWKRDIPELLE